MSDRRPYSRVYWSIRETPIWLDDAALAAYIRAKVEQLGRRRPYMKPSVWDRILRRYGNRCVYCGRSDVPLEREHRIAYSKGGATDETNIVPACKPCNVRKHDGDPADWPMVVAP